MAEQEREKDGMITSLLRQLKRYEDFSTPLKKVGAKN